MTVCVCQRLYTELVNNTVYKLYLNFLNGEKLKFFRISFFINLIRNTLTYAF